MAICEQCEYDIPEDSDEHFNSNHDLIFCPQCGKQNECPIDWT